MYLNMENRIAVLITKRMEIIPSIYVWHISWMNFDYEENGGKKGFLANPKHQYCVAQGGEHHCSACNTKNGAYYGYPGLSHFQDKL